MRVGGRVAAVVLVLSLACTGADTPSPESKGPAKASPSGPATKPVKKKCTWEIATLAEPTDVGSALIRVTRPGLELAVKVANADPEVPCRLKIVARDLRGGQRRFLRTAGAVAGRKKVIACVCGGTHDEANPVVYEFSREGIMSTSPIASAGIFPFRTWFRSNASDLAIADMAALYIRRAVGARNVVIAREGRPAHDGYAGLMADALGQAARLTSVRVAGSNYVEDARRIVKMDPDAVFVDAYLSAAIVFAQDLRKAGFDGPLFSHNLIMSAEFGRAGAGAENSFAFCGCIQPVNHEPAAEFVALHRKVYDEDPGPRAAEVFDMITFVARSLRKLDGDEPIADVRRHVVRYFRRARSLKGIAKTYSWGQDGELLDVKDDVVVYEWSRSDDTWVQLGTVEELLPQTT